MIVNVMWLFLTVPWVDLQYVIAVLSVLSCFEIILIRKRELIGLFYLFSTCLFAFCDYSSRVLEGLKCLIVVFPGHTQLRFY